MVQTQALLRSLRTLAKKRLSLKAMERRLDGDERQLMGAIGRMLSGLGYRVVAVNGHDAKTSRSARPRRRLTPTNLKCPKCDRRFSFVMHMARHMSAMHGTKKRGGKKAPA
jgi:uncharacterized C2H2 Zn-finger protein